MIRPFRRWSLAMAAALVLAGALPAGPAHAQAREEKVVYHINDSANALAALRNIRNHLDASPKATIVVVTHGPGIDFLLDGAKDRNGNPYDATVAGLTQRKVQFRVCQNTLTQRNIDPGKVIPEASIVPSGVAEIARLQAQEGFVYLKP
jgi:intracellular sulfur oxidation DsrE/DsrF family protein